MNSTSTLRQRSIGGAGTLTCAALFASLLYVGAASIAHADGTGWFTQAQAERGWAAYQASCGTCDDDALRGTDAPALKGASFLAHADSSDSRSSAQDSTQQNEVTPATVTEPLDPPSDTQDAKDNEASQAKLKGCEGMSSPGDKKECADEVKKEHGQM